MLGPRRSASMPSISPRAFEVESVAMASPCGGVPAKRFRGVKNERFANLLNPNPSVGSGAAEGSAPRHTHPQDKHTKPC